MHERDALLAEIAAEMRDTERWTGRSSLSPRVAAALAKVRREAFAPPDAVEAAYINRPLSIGCGQTISQPFIVALMTELLGLLAEHTVTRRRCLPNLHTRCVRSR
jgi:protein-L-isoaspartate(D-aspartate) O-methyltransferase